MVATAAPVMPERLPADESDTRDVGRLAHHDPLPPTHRDRIDMFDRIFLFLIWIREGRCVIQNRDTNAFEPLRLRRVQLEIIQEMLRQAATCPRCHKQTFGYGRENWACKHCSHDPAAPVFRGMPIRIIIPKARKMGMSTLIQAWGVFCVEHFPGVYALTLAHTTDDTRKIFDIALRVHQRGAFDPTNRPSFIAEPHGSMYMCKTGGGKFSGSGGTPSILHISELAKWTGKRGDVSADKEAMASLLGSIPFASHTCVFIESTGMGPAGEFYDRCKGAYKRQFGDRQYVIAGENGDGQPRIGDGDERASDETLLGFRLMFFPWWQDEEYAKPPAIGWAPSPDDEEIREAIESEYGVRLTDDQLYWRHWKMLSDDLDEITFTREFPNTFLDCFAALEGRVYPRFGMTKRYCRELPMSPFTEAMKDPDNDRNKVGLMRSMDVGFSGSHRWVILWIAYNNAEPPQLVINPNDPGCEQLIEEMLVYAWEKKNDKPKKEHDHGPDALRYAVTSNHLTGLVYVYRAHYYENAFKMDKAQERVARDIHEVSGWEIPPDRDANDIANYEPAAFGEQFYDNVCDRAAKGVINLFNGWGLPFRPHPQPEKALQINSEVKWGINHVNALITSSAWIDAPKVDRQEQLVQEAIRWMQGKTPNGRRWALTAEHEEALRRAGIEYGQGQRMG